MNASNILDMARQTTWTSSSMTNFSDADLLDAFNLNYHELEDWAVTEYKDDLFQKEYKVDTVIDQYKYARPTAAKKIQEVAIKYTTSSDEKYTPLIRMEADYIGGSNDYHAVGATKFYDLEERYIKVFPAPTAVVTEWIYTKCIVNLDDLIVASVSADIFPYCRFSTALQKLLMYAMRVHLYLLSEEDSKAEQAEAKLEREKRKTLAMMRSIETKQNTFWKGRPLDTYFKS